MTIEDLGSVEPLQGPHGAPDVGTRREQFRQANASLALEGMAVSTADLAIQAKISAGELTADQAVAIYLERTRRGSA